jgi:hypothetical protein
MKRFKSLRNARILTEGVKADSAHLHKPFSRLAQYGLVSCALLGLTTGAMAQDTAKPDAAKKDDKKEIAQTPPAPAAQTTPAAPAAPAAPAPGTVSYSGLIDVYYGINARAPKAHAGYVTPGGEVINVDNSGRAFDINDRDPSLSLAEFNITRTPGKGFPLGVTATLTFGDTSRIVNANEPGGSSWQSIQQLYVTYTPHILGRDIAIDFGKWVTPFGNEVIESSSNDNYSRSFGFTYGIPLYHAGLRATVPINPKLSLVGGIVNGWNNVADDNDAKSGLLQFTWKPDAKFTGILGYMGGEEGTGAYGSAVQVNKGYIDTNLFEFVPTYQISSAWKVAGDLVYGTGAGNVAGTHVDDDWFGMAAYVHLQTTSKVAVALRVEQFEDSKGLRVGLPGYTKLDSLTLTLEYAVLHGHLINRLEYRHDWSSQDFYAAGSGFAKDQDTYYYSAVYKF